MNPEGTEPENVPARNDRTFLLYPLFGLVAGTTVMVCALLPSNSDWGRGLLIALLGAVGGILISRITNADLSARQYRWKITWFITVAALLVGGTVLASTISHVGGALWLSWVMAALVVGAVSSGAWFVAGRPLRRSGSKG